MIDKIELILAFVGFIAVLFLLLGLWIEAHERFKTLCSQWKFHSDSANENRDKIRKIEERMNRLNQEIEFLQGEMAEFQPKKAKSK